MILIVDLNYRKDSLAYNEFVKPIAAIIKSDFFIKHFSELNAEDITQASKIIFSGTTLKDNEVLNHAEKFSWLKTCNKPVLGICAGMHVLGKVFGCELEKVLEIGLGDIKTIQENPLFSGEFQAYQLHGLVVKSNEQFIVLASSEKCVQAIKHKEKEIYGLVFHPEVRNQGIIEAFLKRA